MIRAKLGDKLLTLEIKEKGEQEKLKAFLTYKDNKNAMAGGTFNPMYVRKVCYLKESKKVPGNFVLFSGFAKEVLQFAKENNIETELVDLRTHFDFQKKEFNYRSFFNEKFDYTQHQERALEKMHHSNCGIIKAITSAGKGDIMSAYVRMSGLSTLVLVDRATLAKQLFERFKKDGIDCGLCCSGFDDKKDIMISTIQSVKKLDGRKFDCLIGDEIHRFSGKSFTEFLKNNDFSIRFGFSATPFGGDYYLFSKIRQFLGSIIIEIKADELIENKVVSPPLITFVKNRSIETFDYISAYDLAITNNKNRNDLIAGLASKFQKGIAILISRIEHGEILNSMIEGSVLISGKTSMEERESVMEKFEKDEIKVMIASDIMREGISINNIQVLILAGAGKAVSGSLQKCGRAMRLHPDKKKAIIFDFEDTGNYFLEKHSKIRRRLYKNEGFEVR
jgi:superfamily II DNA or RNA helicase